MKAAGSKLIKTAHAYGHDIFWDVDSCTYVLYLDGELLTSKDVDDLFREAEYKPKRTGFYESKTNIGNS